MNLVEEFKGQTDDCRQQLETSYTSFQKQYQIERDQSKGGSLQI